MQIGQSGNEGMLRGAVEVAIAKGELPKAARNWGKTVLLEELASGIGFARHKLRNLYYRGDPRLEAVLQSYVADSHAHVMLSLGNLPFQGLAPVVWKRPAQEVLASSQALPSALALARAAERIMREHVDPPLELRRAIGGVAAEIMACAVTFLVGSQRWQMLMDAELLFLSAMSPLAFKCDIEQNDALLFARFWENRASRCGLEWSNIWDDPALPPTIGMDVVRLALEELEQAGTWMCRHAGGAKPGDDGERVQQLMADKAKWLAKAGRFAEAEDELAKLPDRDSRSGRADVLLVRTLELITGNRLAEAGSSAGLLAELIGDDAEGDEIGAVACAMMRHNIELLRGRGTPVPAQVQHFLATSPVVASEAINLPRYRARLEAQGYLAAETPSAPTVVAR